MIKKIKLLAANLAMTAMLALPLLAVAPVSAQANIEGELNQGTCLSTNAGDCPSVNADARVNSLVADVINIFSWVVGIVSVIMIIVGGFQYITSGGASDKVSNAKNTILYAIIGLVIVALAQFIVRFVLQRVTAP